MEASDPHPDLSRSSPRHGVRWVRSLLGLAWWVSVVSSVTLVAHGSEMLVPTNAVWSFRKGTSEASTPREAWRQAGFDDSGWTSGQAPFFYDTDGVYTGATRLDDMRNAYTSVYLRRPLVVRGVSDLGGLRLRVFCDDGFVLWLNGILATNLNQQPDNVAFNATASGNASEPLEWKELTLGSPAAWLQEGTNQVAVQVFNTSRSSSDLVFEMELAASLRDASPPTITEVDPAPGVVGELRQITVTFSEPVQGVGFSDLLVNERPAVGVSGGGARYTFLVEPPGPGPVVVGWDAGSGVSDLADPPNPFDAGGPAARWAYQIVDQTPPAILDLTPVPGTTLRNLSQVDVRFSEPVAGVDAGDLRLGGETALFVSGIGAGPYRFTFPEAPPGLVELAWVPGHGIRDEADPSNPFPGGSWQYTLDPAFATQPVRIGEILAAHLGVTGLRDEDGEIQDWIELENRGTAEVNLLGWSLSDDPGDPGRWVFPETRLRPGSFLVVFASGKDRRLPGGGKLHTNFKLGAGGGYLGLFDAGSPRTVVSQFLPEYPSQRPDISFGYDSAGRLRYFGIPTPGTPNGDSLIEGALPEVSVNVGRGVFEHAFDLLLSSPVPGAEIRYTLDGEDPGGSGPGVQRYTGPLRIGGTTILRVTSVKAGYLPSVVGTHTYIFPAQVVHQPANPPGVPDRWIDPQGRSWTADYEMDPEIVDSPVYRDRVVPALKSLPVLSIVTRPADMFDNATGIYPKSQSRGPAWERPASAEILDWERGQTVQVNCGVQMQGNSVRDPVKTGKHAFRLVFKSQYGPAKLRYRVFPDSPLEEYDTLTVRADFNNSWMHWNGAQRPRGQRVRDAWMKESQRAMGGLASRSRFFHLYVNGLYWGLYDAVERPDAAFAAAHLGGDKSEFDVVNEGQLVDGTMTAYNAMRALTGVDTQAGYERMKGYLDIPAYIDYVLLHFYTGHEDWFTDKNWYASRRRVPGAGFRYQAWDGELMLNSPGQNIVTRTDQPSGLHQKLLTNPQYRIDFADRVQRHLFGSGALTPAAAAARYERWADLVESAMVAESARWGDYRRDVHAYQSPPYELYTVDGHFRAERERLRTQYFPTRTATVLSQLKAAGLYPAAVNAPVFGTAEGRVPPDASVALTVPGGPGTIWFSTDGSDPRVPFTGAIAASASAYIGPIRIPSTTLVRARTRSGADWSALAEARFDVGVPGIPLVFTEVHYHPAGGDPYEFFELQNRGVLPLDVSGFSLTGVNYRFPAGMVLGPGQVWLVASGLSPETFAARYPRVLVDGWFLGSLSDGGERVALLDPDGKVVESVSYSDRGAWPREADGLGASLERVDFSGDPDLPSSWRASASEGGSPRVVPSAAGGWNPVGVRISELSAAEAGAAADWLELENPGTEVVDLGGWTLSDAGSGSALVLPAGTRLEGGGGRLVVWCVGTEAKAGGGRLEAGFALDADGDTVVLADAAGVRRDVVSFGGQVAGYSLGRVEPSADWVLCAPTPGVRNRAVEMASHRDLVINEWLSDSTPGGSDWVELFNRDPSHPTSLRGCWLTLGGAAHRVGDASFLPPGGFRVLRADEGEGPGHLDFRLPAAGGTLSLHDPAGVMVDDVVLGEPGEGESRGRLPDGGEQIVSFAGFASPGTANHLGDEAGPRFHEILAFPASGAGWIEWHGAGPGPGSVPLGGATLSLDRAEEGGGEQAWTFPAGVSIPAGGFLVVRFDAAKPPGPDGAGGWNTGFALPPRGGRLRGWAASGRLLDEVTFGFQVRGRSVGQTAAGWQLLREPTPGAINAPALELGTPDGLRVNEWMAWPSSGADWVELYNSGSAVVALDGLRLEDHPGLSGLRAWSFAPLSFVGAAGFVVVTADGDPGKGPAHAGFQLASSGESLVLSRADGRWLDAVFFGAQVQGVSQGRLPDGAGSAGEFLPRPTPGQGNATRTPAVPTMEAVRWEGTAMRLRILGDSGFLYRLEWSPDLVRWEERVSGEPTTLPWEVLVPLPEPRVAGFFRVLILP